VKFLKYGSRRHCRLRKTCTQLVSEKRFMMKGPVSRKRRVQIRDSGFRRKLEEAHAPVMLNEMLAGFAPKDGIYIDGTFGAGGYSRNIARQLPCICY
jgi:hypothetical protein